MTITFFLMKLLPGSPYNDEKLSEEQKVIINEKYGLNDPTSTIRELFKNVAKGDFGISFQYDNREVWSLIKPRLGPSVEMGTYAMILGTITGLLLGIVAAIRQNTIVDYGATFLSVIFISVPSFVLAVLLQYVFAVEWQIFPVAGWSGFMTAVLPSIALAAGVTATIARYIRSEMIEVLSSDYIELARAKGMSSARVIFWPCSS